MLRSEFYGQKTSSHHGKYRYRRHSLLDEISYNKLIEKGAQGAAQTPLLVAGQATRTTRIENYIIRVDEI
uniref:Uncharacterized protein n=1 Tax=Candidatus Methanogaster sp. ANME-2c ERB4 TaxID=2759911 RepID=A0A7G9YEN9_9EURY|nr:hypothetical protein PAACNKLE_00008 [Methanosarcinales archaeon ANME-2c ERB4]